MCRSAKETRINLGVLVEILGLDAGASPELDVEGIGDLFMCPVVFYELWRGLAYRDARRQLEDLDAFVRTCSGWTTSERCGSTPHDCGLTEGVRVGHTTTPIC